MTAGQPIWNSRGMLDFGLSYFEAQASTNKSYAPKNAAAAWWPILPVRPVRPGSRPSALSVCATKLLMRSTTLQALAQSKGLAAAAAAVS